jgi:hypothetical protein
MFDLQYFKDAYEFYNLNNKRKEFTFDFNTFIQLYHMFSEHSGEQTLFNEWLHNKRKNT